MKKVLVIVPAYNEGTNLEGLFTKIRALKKSYDILVINDCSSDDTLDVCHRNSVTVVDLPVNLGIGGAVQTGYKYAKAHDYDFAVQIDGDGQHNPEYIEPMLERLEEGYNFCIGSRFIQNDGFQSTFARRIGIRYFTSLIRSLTGFTVTDPTSGLRACDRNVIDCFNEYYPHDYPEPETLVLLKKKKYRISEIPVIMNERAGGTSSISSFNSIYYMVKVTLAILISAFHRDRR